MERAAWGFLLSKENGEVILIEGYSFVTCSCYFKKGEIENG